MRYIYCIAGILLWIQVITVTLIIVLDLTTG